MGQDIERQENLAETVETEAWASLSYSGLPSEGLGQLETCVGW